MSQIQVQVQTSLRRLNMLASARAYLRASLFALQLAREYIHEHYTREDILRVEEELKAIIERINNEIGYIVYGGGHE